MAGDRGLAFVIAGKIGVTALWAGSKDLRRVRPAVSAYAASSAQQSAVRGPRIAPPRVEPALPSPSILRSSTGNLRQ